MAAMGEAARLKRRVGRVPEDARLAAGMEPASQRVTALHVACASDWWSHGQGRMAAQLGVAKTLVGHGADLSAAARYRGIEDATPLFCACWSSRNLALVHWLLDQGALATDGHLWAALGHLQRHRKAAYDVAEALLAWGLPVDGGVPGDRTPLQGFAHQGAHKAVAWLIAHGAGVNARLREVERRPISRPRGTPDRRHWPYSLKMGPTLRPGMRTVIHQWRSLNLTERFASLSG
jgi:hypothetical protein